MAVSDEEALLQAIWAEPDDDAPRLVYADWLEENGQPERAEFIRGQCELAREGGSTKARKRLRAREKQLLAAHRENWLARIGASPLRWHFHRGLVDRVEDPGFFASQPCTLIPGFPMPLTWYLKFFRDGYVVVGLSTTSPADIVGSRAWPCRPRENASGRYQLRSVGCATFVSFHLSFPHPVWTADFKGTIQGPIMVLEGECSLVERRLHEEFNWIAPATVTRPSDHPI
jgi:uncharacterized protein (TIGR02996 family)